MDASFFHLPVELGDRSYGIEIASHWLDQLGARIAKLLGSPRLVVVTDSNVSPLYGKRALDSLAAAGLTTSLVEVPAGEESKCPAVLGRIYDHLVAERIPRQGAVVALGGGVVGDLTGFAAATFLRGIDFIQVPTTLLAMVDSSVGGKTGINHPQGKNLIGAFWQPRLVFVDTELLRTLPGRELRSGLAEVVKHGVIRDAAYFAYLETHLDAILALDPEATARVVEGSCRIKAAVVGADERETSGLRAILNFGHTVGHALEAVAGYGTLTHGEAVAIGMEAAGRLALRKGMFDKPSLERLGALLDRIGLPRRIPGLLSMDAVASAMALDKKVMQGRLRFVLPRALGEVELVDTVSADEVRAVLCELHGG